MLMLMQMPTLHKFKLLATQCAVAGSPTRSPTTSPVIHLRRRKTLRMFLTRPERRRFPRRDGSPDLREDPPEMTDNEVVRVRHKLKDLFISSPPPIGNEKRCREQQRQEQEAFLPSVPSSGIGVRFRTGSAFRRGGGAALRPVSSAFRYRLLRRAWRPMLVTIPE